MGKCDDSLSVSLQAKDLLHQNDSTLMDDLTLSTLQIVFQRLDRCSYLFVYLFIYSYYYYFYLFGVVALVSNKFVPFPM